MDARDELIEAMAEGIRAILLWGSQHTRAEQQLAAEKIDKKLERFWEDRTAVKGAGQEKKGGQDGLQVSKM